MAKYKKFHMGDLNPEKLVEELAASTDLPSLTFEQRGFEQVTRSLVTPAERVLTRSHGDPTPDGTALAGEYVIHSEEDLTLAERDEVAAILAAHDPADLSKGQSNTARASEFTDYIVEWIEDDSKIEAVNYRSAWLAAWRSGGFA